MNFNHGWRKWFGGAGGDRTEPKTWLPEVRDPETRRALAESLVDLFRRWQLREADQAALLGLEDVTSLTLGAPLPDTPEALERAGHLLAIGRALKRRYPYQPLLRDRWINEPQAVFMFESPLDIMLSKGGEGIRLVRASLEEQGD